MTTQNSRLLEVDFGRGMAVFLMMLVHTLWMYGDKFTQEESIVGHVMHFVGKGTAAFLILMGISFIISKNQCLKAAMLRGLLILTFAYMMNFLKFIIPLEVFGTMPEAFVNAYGWQSPLNFGQLRYIFLTGDILQMAGIALFILAVIRHYVKNKWGYLIIGLLIAGASRETSGYQPGIEGLDYIARLFFSNHYQVYFPVFPWMSFILFGMFLGKLVTEQPAKRDYMFSKLPLIASISLIIGGGLCAWNFKYHFGNFFHLGPGGTMYLLGVNLWILFLIHKIVKSGMNNFITRFFYFCSERVTSMYIIQWTVVCWGMGIIGFQTLPPWQTICVMPFVVLITLIIQTAKDRGLPQSNSVKQASAS